MTLRLTDPELHDLTGGLKLPRVQLRHLHKAGFWRARLGIDGKVILERAHYEAVCAGALPPGTLPAHTAAPQLRPVRRAA